MMIIKGWIGSDQTSLQVDYEIHIDDELIEATKDKAAFIGAPLPLCSCGVIPAALALRRQGASRGSVMSLASCSASNPTPYSQAIPHKLSPSFKT